MKQKIPRYSARFFIAFGADKTVRLQRKTVKGNRLYKLPEGLCSAPAAGCLKNLSGG